MKDATHSCSRGSELGTQHDMQLDYAKMIKVAEDKGLAIVDVAMDGDCALHAIIRQLQQQGTSRYDVRMLRKLAVEFLELNPDLVNLSMISRYYGGNSKAYLKEQAIQGTLCNKAMLHAVSKVTTRGIHLFEDDGSVTKFEPHQAYTGKFITIGLIASVHYVSLEPRSTFTNKHTTAADELLDTFDASAATGERYKAHEHDQRATGSQEAVWRHSYSKLKSEAERRRLSVVDVPQTKDSALRAVVYQLLLQNITSYDVTSLLRDAEDYLSRYTHLIEKKPTDVHTLSVSYSDESVLRAVSDVIMKEIHVLHDDGHMSKIGIQTSHTKPVIIGVFGKTAYVSLEPSSSRETTRTAKDVDTEPGHNRHAAGLAESTNFQNNTATAIGLQRASPTAAVDGNGKALAAAAGDTCAICMDVIKNPKTLPCAHVFCSECIEQSLVYQPKCPCCGKILGVLKGDQPEGGRMTVTKEKWLDLEGYPGCGHIVIEYFIPDGRQEV